MLEFLGPVEESFAAERFHWGNVDDFEVGQVGGIVMYCSENGELKDGGFSASSWCGDDEIAIAVEGVIEAERLDCVEGGVVVKDWSESFGCKKVKRRVCDLIFFFKSEGRLNLLERREIQSENRLNFFACWKNAFVDVSFLKSRFESLLSAPEPRHQCPRPII